MSNNEELRIANHNCVYYSFWSLVDCLHVDRNKIVTLLVGRRHCKVLLMNSVLREVVNPYPANVENRVSS